MPRLIRDLHEFAFAANRDVLCISFRTKNFPLDNCRRSPMRDEVKKWLIENQIAFMPCCFKGDLSYCGELYIDLPYDNNNPKYVLLEQYLENPDGTSKLYGVTFYYMTLEEAHEIDLLPDEEW